MPLQESYKAYLGDEYSDAEKEQIIAQLEKLEDIAIESYYANKRNSK